MDCSLSEGASQYLDVLYEEYEHFDIQQTTVGVNPNEFAALEEHPDGMAIRVRVGSDDGTLMLPGENEWELPGGVIDTEPVPERISSFVERETGVRSEIDSLDRVSIVCLQCEVIGDEIWTLSALFTATAVGGSPRNGAIWRDPPLDPMPALSLS